MDVQGLHMIIQAFGASCLASIHIFGGSDFKRKLKQLFCSLQTNAVASDSKTIMEDGAVSPVAAAAVVAAALIPVDGDSLNDAPFLRAFPWEALSPSCCTYWDWGGAVVGAVVG